MKNKFLNYLLVIGSFLSVIFVFAQNIFVANSFYGFLLFVVLLYFSIRKDITNFIILSIFVMPFATQITFFSITFVPVFGILLFLNYLLNYKADILNNIFLFLVLFSVFISTLFFENNALQVFASFTGLYGPFFVLLISRNKNVYLPYKTVFIPLIYIPVFLFEILMKPEWGGEYMGGQFRLFGLCGQPNVFAAFIYPFAFISFSIFFQNRKNIYLIIGLIYTLLTLLTFSRGGFVSLFIGFVLLIIFINYKVKINWKTISLFILIFLAVGFSKDLVKGTRLENIGGTELENQRGVIWQNVLFKLQNHYSFGVGLGGYESQIQNYVTHFHTTHNLYLNYFANIGIVGLLLVLILFLYFLYSGLKQILISRPCLFSAINRGALISFFVLLVHGFVNSGTLSAGNALYTLVIVGSLSSLPLKNKVINYSANNEK